MGLLLPPVHPSHPGAVALLVERLGDGYDASEAATSAAGTLWYLSVRPRRPNVIDETVAGERGVWGRP